MTTESMASANAEARAATGAGPEARAITGAGPEARAMDLLRFATAGSVDDGKSTLIGRLLYDTKSLFTDQLAAVEAVSAARGDEYTNLALLTDGLRAEREQGITIDVAYRYFATPRRKFIIADTPGHIQYTRNMVTGASTADLALILVDARKGLVEQSRRHAFLCSLLRVPHLVLCVNKMDLVDWSQEVYERIADEFTAFAAKLDVPDLTVVPISALRGDNIVTRSENMQWYEGPSLLHHLERVHIASDRNLVDVRFPVQYVIRPQSTTVTDYRGYAGQVASGVLKPGDEVMVLPSGFTSRIAAVETADGPVAEAFPPMSVTVRLADEIDISRGDLICRPNNAPAVAQDIEAMVCWMDETAPLRVGGRYAIKHTTRSARAIVRGLHYRLDINSLHRDESADELRLNEIGRVRLRTTVPLLADEYRRNRTTGGFVIIDETTNRTVGAAMIVEAA
ncbi:sulfate adenylyltransferase subunit 1 [Micromonospora orduensis]|uniref:sulfate adenylyltransferase subunit 1 n=2 Tax=Micromonospora orduensis TaxID=1420891 RepID=UPI0033F5E460